MPKMKTNSGSKKGLPLPEQVKSKKARFSQSHFD